MDKGGFQPERLAQGLEYGRYGLKYGVLPSAGYGVLDLVSFVVFGECRHRYAVSSLMDTAYWLSEQIMNPQETQQVAARDEKWVPSTERVKISSTNMSLKSLCTIYGTPSKFLLANKKCIFDAKVFRKILAICPRVEGEEFTKIDHKKERKSRRETMPITRFIKVIINHFLSQQKSLFKLQFQHYHTIKDDGIVSRLEFIRIGEDYQEYGLSIPDMMLNDAIKRLESYQMFLKYSTGQIPPKKSRGKCSQGKKTTDTPVADVNVSKESDSEPAKKRTASRRVVKKKVTISAADNIIHNLDVSLELGKSISLTKAAEEEAARQVHDTHARILIESAPEPTKKRLNKKLQILCKLSKKARKPAEDSQVLEAQVKELVGYQGFPMSPQSSLPPQVKELGSEQESEYSKEDQGDDEEVDWIYSEEDDEKKDDVDDDKSIDLEMTDDEETDDEFVHGDEQVNDNDDEEMTNAEVEDSRKGNAEISDVAKADAEKIEEIKDDAKKAKLPPTSSNLSISLGFGDQFLKLSSDTSLVGTAKDTTDAEINSLLDIKIQSEVPYIQSPYVLTIPVSVISKTVVPIPIPETPLVAPSTTLLPPPSVSTIPHQRVAKLEKDVSELKKTDHSAESLATLKSQVPTVVEHYLKSKIGDDLQKVLQRHTADLIQKYSVKPTPEFSKIQKPTIDLEQESEKSAIEIRKIKREHAEKQKMPKYTIKSIDKAALKEYDLKSALYQTMHENMSFNRNPANHALYHALMEALIEDKNAMDKRVADTVKNHKRQHDDDDDDDDEDPLAGPNHGKKTKRRRTEELESSNKPSTTKETPKGKASSKGSKTGKSASEKEPVEEPIAEVVMDDAVNTAGEEVYLKTYDPEKTYTTSITKTKAAQYDIVVIEDMVLTLWSTIKHVYDKDAEKGIKHWGERRDFLDLHLNDIKDMLLLAVQHKLFHLNDSDIVDFILALQSYQKKLNITAPQKTFPEIEFKELYTPSYKPPGRKWTAIDKKRSELIVELIDKQMRERRIIRNLERLVGAQELEMDYKLMTRNV
ncbi:hypothetical protein Tco_1175961 [Tanacetum coccineum]